MRDYRPPISYPQIPDLDLNFIKNCERYLAHVRGLVNVREVRAFRHRLTRVEKGEAFLLHIGPCHEDADQGTDAPLALWAMVQELMPKLEQKLGRAVVPLLRGAGQMSKPRSQNYETIGNRRLPVFRGHMFHEPEATLAARMPCAKRVRRSYQAAFEISQALKAAKGFKHLGAFSHEALLLQYEGALLTPTFQGGFFASSAHLIWIGARTHDAQGEHVKFAAMVENPVGIKVSPTVTPDHLQSLIETINPSNEEGKILLIFRFGKQAKPEAFRPLLQRVKQQGYHATLISDPMHGNTRSNHEGVKTRVVEDLLEEALTFTQVAKQEGLIPGGIHLEAGEGIFQECLVRGGDARLRGGSYRSLCDPRLNGHQVRYLLNAFAAKLTY